jgi:cullin-associated NEDD8-dissociated protein 1
MEGDDEDGGGWGSEFDDEEVARDDDDDTSWKVRRAAVKAVDTIIQSRPELLRTMYQRHAKSLVNRFKERDDNVKCNILEAF